MRALEVVGAENSSCGAETQEAVAVVSLLSHVVGLVWYWVALMMRCKGRSRCLDRRNV